MGQSFTLDREFGTVYSNRKDLPKPAVDKTEEEWKKQLTRAAFRVCRKQGTERAFANEYNSNYRTGTYSCLCCGNELFQSNAKFDSGTGWPSFLKPAAGTSLAHIQPSVGPTEVLCQKCHAHLGHVFGDGPKQQTGLRYCMNSTCLRFNEAAASDDKTA